MLLLLSNICFARSFQGWVFFDQRSAGISCRFSLKPTQWLFCSSLELGNWWECWKTWSTLRFSPPRRIQGWNANLFVLSKWFVLFGNQVWRYQQALRAYNSRLERENWCRKTILTWLAALVTDYNHCGNTFKIFQDCNLQLLLMNLQFDQFRRRLNLSFWMLLVVKLKLLTPTSHHFRWSHVNFFGALGVQVFNQVKSISNNHHPLIEVPNFDHHF